MLWPEDMIAATLGLCAIVVACGGASVSNAIAATQHKTHPCEQIAPGHYCSIDTLWQCGNRDGK